MKSTIFLLPLLLLIAYGNANAQFGAQQIISTNGLEATSVHAADMDGDGDIDVLSASEFDGKIAWYKNTDGQGTFSAEILISDFVFGAEFAYAADIDGDGDMDVLSASYDDDEIAWFENLDGQGNFGTKQVITTDANGAYFAYAADIDGDGDMDVVSASSFQTDSKVAWYENTDGQGNFGPQQLVTTIAHGVTSIYPADIDGDGDLDLFSASSSQGDDRLAWYENMDGLGDFGAQQIISTLALGVESVYAADIDGDGDLDALSASGFDDKIAWYENTDGRGDFSGQKLITINAGLAKWVHAADVDGDGDIDVLAASGAPSVASPAGSKITWYENLDGLGDFGAEIVISVATEEAQHIFTVDIDNDGDIDVLSASRVDNKIAWYENLSLISSVSNNELVGFSVFPTPATDVLTIESESTIVQMDIYNNLGQLVWAKPLTASRGKVNIDISTLNPGLYFCKVKDANGDFGIKKIVKQ